MLSKFIADLSLKDQIDFFIQKATKENKQVILEEIGRGITYLKKMGLNTILDGLSVEAQLIHSAKTGTEDIKYFIKALSHFKKAGLNIELAQIFSARIETENNLHLLDIAAENNSVKCISEILKIRELDWTGVYKYCGRCTLTNATNPETAEILLNAGGGINIGISGQEAFLNFDLTNKVIFGCVINPDGSSIRITRDIAIFKDAITNRFELANAIRENRLSDEVIQNLKQAFLDKKAECSNTLGKGIFLAYNYTLSIINQFELPVFHKYKNEELEHIDDIILILEYVKPKTTLKNIALNFVSKNRNSLFMQYQGANKLPIPEELLVKIPSSDQAERLEPFMGMK